MRLKIGNLIFLIIINFLMIVIGFIRYPYFWVFDSDDTKSNELGFQISFTGISVDSKDNFYIGFDTGIYCYAPSGEFLYRIITPKSTGSYDFAVKDDVITVWLFRSDNKYLYSLSGDIVAIERYEDSERPHFTTSFDQRKAWKNGELIYCYHSLFGFWWVTNEAGRCLSHIPVLMYILKISLLSEFIFCCILLSQTYDKFIKKQFSESIRITWRSVL